MVEFNPMRVRIDAAGIHRRFPMGPLLEVFLLEVRSYRGDARSYRGDNASAARRPRVRAFMPNAR